MNQNTSTELTALRIALIGGGNMARGLIGGLLGRGLSPARITVAEPVASAREALVRDFGIGVTGDNAAAVTAAQVVVLAVKPQQMASVARALSPHLAHRPLVISVAAGIRAADLSRWLGAGIPVVRAMPNRPALTGAGATGLYADASVDSAQRARATAVLGATGLCTWVNDEACLDTVTALSGSGPAYFFLLAELMAQSAIAQGLDAATAQALAAQTLAGAGQLVAAEHTPDLARMRAEVTSKGGTTEAALNTFATGNLAALVDAAMNAAALRSRELAEQFGSD
ncbi:MAG: pyrroline-5-carboxylate reductase [Nevskiaceae bacterium]|jgi:pyrroline-5-carboxylate reductase|nr:pyrroline-5-carboxylate reductase [Nevskiaceae bacterium]